MSTELSEALRQLEQRDLIRYTLLGLLSLDMTNLMIQRSLETVGIWMERKQVQVTVVTEVAGPAGLCFPSRQTQDPGEKMGCKNEEISCSIDSSSLIDWTGSMVSWYPFRISTTSSLTWALPKGIEKLGFLCSECLKLKP